MANVDISNLSVAELEALRGSIENVIGSRRQTELVNLRQAIEDMVEEAGFTLEEVMQAAPPKKRAVPAKYRNPADPSQTWSGRGRKPGWVEELIANGGSLDDCLIQ
ncbi:MAG TPA: H-NS histone family protein [Candidatus Thiothrix moscowensis]|uniref:H-NS histone family protein n=1 Tax=unclassified Thiothrix TaxID=2636184 RepID=UPI001A242E03|nr:MULTISPECIES: H-NS histone family protein [unclassified Thiothrix]MBJ6610341.1 H-NS histone family protein [Candidatus Thiothrix moscowensis]HRJ52778.1 H-NS histone family protein [Candidatus Thiothrix moscowensis]HRJ94453.1 H-NS histone family protein [Candidatus Thiothrix moscowensis]